MRRFCQRNRLEPSMSWRGNCWDNAVAESFFASLKKKRIRKRIYVTREAAIEDVRYYIVSFYNPARRHRHLGGDSPDQFEARAKRALRSVREILGTPYLALASALIFNAILALRGRASHFLAQINGIARKLRWRRGWDSNPRYPCEYAAFRVRCLQPLDHLSNALILLRFLRFFSALVIFQ